MCHSQVEWYTTPSTAAGPRGRGGSVLFTKLNTLPISVNTRGVLPGEHSAQSRETSLLLPLVLNRGGACRVVGGRGGVIGRFPQGYQFQRLRILLKQIVNADICTLLNWRVDDSVEHKKQTTCLIRSTSVRG